MKFMASIFAGLSLLALTAINSSAATSTGVALYNLECVSCHGPLASSNTLGATVGIIQNAISTNYGGMGSLSALTVADIQEIANALALSSTPATVTAPAPGSGSGSATGSTPATSEGATLYNSGCSGCHGSLSLSAVKGSSAQTIQNAINNNMGGMSQFKTYTQAQVSGIAAALGSPGSATSAGTGMDGVSLYGSICASCHGPFATSEKAAATVAGIQNAIKTNQGGMGSLTGISSADILAISSALATSKGAGTGGMSKGLSCSSCHGTNVPGGSSGGGD